MVLVEDFPQSIQLEDDVEFSRKVVAEKRVGFGFLFSIGCNSAPTRLANLLGEATVSACNLFDVEFCGEHRRQAAAEDRVFNTP